MNLLISFIGILLLFLFPCGHGFKKSKGEDIIIIGGGQGGDGMILHGGGGGGKKNKKSNTIIIIPQQKKQQYPMDLLSPPMSYHPGSMESVHESASFIPGPVPLLPSGAYPMPRYSFPQNQNRNNNPMKAHPKAKTKQRKSKKHIKPTAAPSDEKEIPETTQKTIQLLEELQEEKRQLQRARQMNSLTQSLAQFPNLTPVNPVNLDFFAMKPSENEAHMMYNDQGKGNGVYGGGFGGGFNAGGNYARGPSMEYPKIPQIIIKVPAPIVNVPTPIVNVPPAIVNVSVPPIHVPPAHVMVPPAVVEVPAPVVNVEVPPVMVPPAIVKVPKKLVIRKDLKRNGRDKYEEDESAIDIEEVVDPNRPRKGKFKNGVHYEETEDDDDHYLNPIKLPSRTSIPRRKQKDHITQYMHPHHYPPPPPPSQQFYPENFRPRLHPENEIFHHPHPHPQVHYETFTGNPRPRYHPPMMMHRHSLQYPGPPPDHLRLSFRSPVKSMEHKNMDNESSLHFDVMSTSTERMESPHVFFEPNPESHDSPVSVSEQSLSQTNKSPETLSHDSLPENDVIDLSNSLSSPLTSSSISDSNLHVMSDDRKEPNIIFEKIGPPPLNVLTHQFNSDDRIQKSNIQSSDGYTNSIQRSGNIKEPTKAFYRDHRDGIIFDEVDKENDIMVYQDQNDIPSFSELNDENFDQEIISKKSLPERKGIFECVERK